MRTLSIFPSDCQHTRELRAVFTIVLGVYPEPHRRPARSKIVLFTSPTAVGACCRLSAILPFFPSRSLGYDLLHSSVAGIIFLLSPQNSIWADGGRANSQPFS